MKQKTAEKTIIALGTAFLLFVFIIWSAESKPSVQGMIAACTSVLMMWILCLRFVPVWLDSLSAPKPTAAKSQGNKAGFIFLAIILWDAVIILLVFLLRNIFGNGESLVQSLEFWRCTDSQHYLAIAEDWYLSEGSIDRLVQLVFLPGYPVVIRIANIFIDNTLYSGLAVSALSFAGAGVMLYKLVLLDADEACAIRAVKYLCISPAVFFFVSPMSESLFMLCGISCVYFVRRGKTAAGCLLGAYAAFTRSLGVILVVPILFELIDRRARLRDYLKLLIVPLGFAAYLLINYDVSGDAFKFMEYQSSHWGQRLGWFFGTAAYQTEYAVSCISDNLPNFFGLWLPNLLAQIISMLVFISSVKKLRAGYTAYFIAYYAVAVGATWLLSAPRYLAAVFSLPVGLAQLSEKRQADELLSIVSMALGALYLCAFVLRWQVW